MSREVQISQLSGKTIDQEAIELLQACEPPEGYFFGNSGGKDSQICDDLLRRAGVKFDAHYNVSPIDPPQVREHLKQHFPDCQWDYQARGFFKKVLTHGLPSRKRRWCCGYVKEGGGKGRVKVLGMRTAESITRRNYKCIQDNPRLGLLILPVVTWTDADVWQYIAERNLVVNPLYKMGFKRIGCVLCPFCSKDEVKLSMTLFPKTVFGWRRACEHFFEDRIARGKPVARFNSAEELWQWWIAR